MSGRSLTAAVLACACLAAPAFAASGPTVIFTVDVESVDGYQLPDQMDARCLDGSPCGLKEIARQLERRGWAGTFFLNVYENGRWGDATLQQIARTLQDGGHDVALHTHPHWAYDESRWAMYDYSASEQVDIIREGARLLEKWTGQRVVAHRAGAYAANRDTLDALERNGILIDSSLFWQHPNSRLETLGLPHNLPSRRGGVMQIPVTAYYRDEWPRHLPRLLAPVSTVRKIDPDWFRDDDEMKAALDAVVAADLPVMVVFLHSFSLVQPRPDGSNSGAIFGALLDEVERRDLPVITTRRIAENSTLAMTGTTSDIVPHVSTSTDPLRYTWHRLRKVDATILGIGSGLAVVCAAAALVAVRRRQRGRVVRTR